jgi:hypothetical protein
MEKQPGQFGILALFVLMTAAAIGFAIVRLEVPLILKMCVVFAIVVCFYGWAVRNRKYPDPRQVARVPQSPARRRMGLVIGLLYPVAFIALMLGPEIYRSGFGPQAFPLGAFLILMIVAGTIRLVRNW